jgi:hypothetical protein
LEEKSLDQICCQYICKCASVWGTTVPLRFFSLPSEAMAASVIVPGLQLRDTRQELEKSLLEEPIAFQF